MSLEAEPQDQSCKVGMAIGIARKVAAQFGCSMRVAIGAQKRDILGLILRESTRPVIGGLLAGMILAAGASYVLRGMLYGLNTVDGISFVGVALLFLAIALLAAYPPSRRAMRVDPVVALRYE
jgi:ABC-type antimicrobial peptide transport system permease subunit